MKAPGGQSLRLVVGVEFGRVEAGLVEGEKWLAATSRTGNAVEELAPLLRSVFADAPAKPEDTSEWIYSGGPGSLLALRTLAMTLETWAALGACPGVRRRRFSGMVWAARELLTREPDGFLLVTPWRTGAWNVLPVPNGPPPPSEEDLAVVEGKPSNDPDRPVFLIGSRPGSPPPVGAIPVPPPPFDTLPAHLDEPGFLRDTPTAEPVQSGSTTYRRWTARPHAPR